MECGELIIQTNDKLYSFGDLHQGNEIKIKILRNREGPAAIGIPHIMWLMMCGVQSVGLKKSWYAEYYMCGSLQVCDGGV